MADINSRVPMLDASDGTDGATAPSAVQAVGGVDGSGNLQSMSVDTSGRPIVNVNGSVAVTGTFFQATQPVSGTVAATQSGTWNITNVSGTVSLPTGAATSALQTTINTSINTLLKPANTLAAVTTLGTITNALPAGTNLMGKVGIDQTTPGTTNAVTITSVSLSAATPTFGSVGITSASLVAANSSRKGLVLVNTSGANVSFGIGTAAVLNRGITLIPGGVWEMDSYTFTTGAINAIAALASSNVSVQEFS